MLQRLKVASIAFSYRHYVAAYLAGRVHSLPSAASGFDPDFAFVFVLSILALVISVPMVAFVIFVIAHSVGLA